MSLCKNLSRKCVRLAAFVSLVAASALAAQAQVVFSPPKNISNSATAGGAQIAVDLKGNINVVWLNATTSTSPVSFTAFFSRSSDGGATFSTPQSISHPGSSVGVLGVASGSSGTVYVLWSDNSAGKYEIFFTRSIDGGNTFSAPQTISHAGSNSAGGQMVVDSSGNINVVWSDNGSGSYAGFLSRSVDGGASFSPPVNLPAAGQFNVDSSGNIYLAWVGPSTRVFSGVTYQGYSIFFSASSDGGATFSSPTDVTFFGPHEILWGFQLAADSMTNINILWQMQITDPVSATLSYSNNGGASFQTTSVTSGCEWPSDPDMALNHQGGVGVIWSNSCGNGTSNVAFAGYSGARTGGANWNVFGNTPRPLLAIDSSGNIDAFFASQFTRSTDGGASFSPLQNGPMESAPGYVDAMTTDPNGSVYFLWTRVLANGNDIFFSRSVGLSSVTLSAADLTGGTSLTGTVTMNGPAPTGGAVISLSSSDASVSVPATVTIAEGTTSGTFAATTNAVGAATTATISATFSGVTQTATITVEPPVLTTLAMNPSSTMGGSSSTGTVTLSGPAPAGGAVVALTNSNTAVTSVPSSVTVPAGFTNATFTASTSRVLCPNSATITASFNGVSQAVSLAVMPFVTLPSQACSAIGAHGGGPGQ